MADANAEAGTAQISQPFHAEGGKIDLAPAD